MVNRMNVNNIGITGKKRSRNTNNLGKVVKTSAREVNLEPIQIGVGMGCPRRGIPRYLKIAKDRLEPRGIVPVFLDYSIASNQYGMLKNVARVIERYGTPNVTSRISPSNQPHFIMVGMRSPEGGGHAVSVLVDPPNKQIWVFDPYGSASQTTIYGRTMREKIVPLLRRMWNIQGQGVRYYNGNNLQSNNTRGTCSTYYITFMDMIPYLIAGVANINQIERFVTMNSTQIRQFYLNFAPQNVGRIVVKNVRKRV